MKDSARLVLALVRRDFGFKVLSVIIGVLLYAVATDQRNPPTTRQVFVSPQIVNLPNDMVIKSSPPGASIMVSGQAAAVTAFNAQSIKATIDVSRARVGVNTLPILYKYPVGALDIESAPPLAEVVLDKKTSSTFFVESVLDNDAPSGYMYGEPTITPPKVTVYGSATEVARVGRIIAQVANDNSRAVDTSVLVSAQDLRKQGVDTVQIEPARVRIVVPLKKAQGEKSVLLSALMTGSPAPGFVVVGYAFSPTMITMTGTQTLLAARSSLTVPVEIDNLSETETRLIKITPPAGLMLASPKQSTVRVRLDVRRITPPTPPAPIEIEPIVRPIPRPSELPAPTPAPPTPSPDPEPPAKPKESNL